MDDDCRDLGGGNRPRLDTTLLRLDEKSVPGLEFAIDVFETFRGDRLYVEA